MKVRTIHPDGLDQLRAAQAAWLEAEFVARAAYALVRLDSLDALAPQITKADRFDAAYAIWDDYIDGRRADERFEPLTTEQLREQASIFARIVRYIGHRDAMALALTAWRRGTFEVYTRTPAGTITGKLGWYTGDTLRITTAAFSDRDTAFEGSTHTIWNEQGRTQCSVDGVFGRRIALHPVFGRADS